MPRGRHVETHARKQSTRTVVKVLAILAVIAVVIPAILFVPDLFTSTVVIHHVIHHVIGGGYTPPRIPHVIPPRIVPHVPHIIRHLYTVHNGDTLWTIAFRLYGNGLGYAHLYALNHAAVGSNPNVIHTGLVLRY